MGAGEGKFPDAAAASSAIEHESSPRGVRPLVKAWAVALLLYTVIISGGLVSEEITRVVNDIAWTIAAALAAISSFRAAFSLQGRDRIAWLIFAAACAAWTAGQIVWDVL